MARRSGRRTAVALREGRLGMACRLRLRSDAPEAISTAQRFLQTQALESRQLFFGGFRWLAQRPGTRHKPREKRIPHCKQKSPKKAFLPLQEAQYSDRFLTSQAHLLHGVEFPCKADHHGEPDWLGLAAAMIGIGSSRL